MFHNAYFIFVEKNYRLFTLAVKYEILRRLIENLVAYTCFVHTLFYLEERVSFGLKLRCITLVKSKIGLLREIKRINFCERNKTPKRD